MFGHFPRELAATILGGLMTAKLVGGACLVLAQQRFLQKKGLVLLFLTSLLANVLIAFLHAFVPFPLVSLTDALAAIIVAILGLIWAILLLIGAVIGVLRVIQPGQRKKRQQAIGSAPALPASSSVAGPAAG